MASDLNPSVCPVNFFQSLCNKWVEGQKSIPNVALCHCILGALKPDPGKHEPKNHWNKEKTADEL